MLFRSSLVFKAQLKTLSPKKEEDENDTRDKGLLAGQEPATSSRWEGEHETGRAQLLIHNPFAVASHHLTF